MSINKLTLPNALSQKPNVSNSATQGSLQQAELPVIGEVNKAATNANGVDLYRAVSSFSFDSGLEKAAEQAMYYMNSLLHKDGLQAKFDESKGFKEVQVIDINEKNEVSRYSLQQVVKFYADAKEAKGIIYNQAI